MEEVVEQQDESKATTQAKERGMYYFELFLTLLLGVLLGIVAKTEASKRITIGFDDYRVAPKAQNYDFAQIEKDLAKQKADQANSGSNAAAAPVGGSCGQ